MSAEAGFGKVDVTPPPDTHLCGFAARTGRAEGVHDRLYARALVVAGPGGRDRTALVACDVIGLDVDRAAEVRRRVERVTGVPADAVVVTATHTHGGPPTMPGRLGGNVDEHYVERLTAGAVDAVRRADESRVPARLGLAIGSEPTVAHNRRLPGGPIDPNVYVVRVDREDGGLLGLVCQYACHPVTLGPDNLLVTADYPGYLVRALETRYPGAAAMFVTGCAGQLNTGHSAADSITGRTASRRTYAEAERIGGRLAKVACDAVDAMPVKRDPLSCLGFVTRPVRLPLRPVAPAARLLADAERWQRESEDAEPGPALMLRAWADWARRVASDDRPAAYVDASVTALRWGELSVVGLPGEPFVELGLEIRRRAGEHVVVLGYAGGVPGYVPHRSAYAEGGYEPCEAHRFYGQPAGFAPEAGEHLVEAALAAIDEVT
ncbi:MAG TPA: neutral/alkaline non-lysosomal ceramidase N-terminal domain-containing protein [Streptosporangiales bacterium]